MRQEPGKADPQPVRQSEAGKAQPSLFQEVARLMAMAIFVAVLAWFNDPLLPGIAGPIVAVAAVLIGIVLSILGVRQRLAGRAEKADNPQSISR